MFTIHYFDGYSNRRWGGFESYNAARMVAASFPPAYIWHIE